MIRKFLPLFLFILSVPIALMEYLILFMYWGGDGTFISLPVIFVVLLVPHIVFINKYKEKKLLCTILKFSIFIVIPILTITLLLIISKITGVDINIQ
jgi:hypothetical protein